MSSISKSETVRVVTVDRLQPELIKLRDTNKKMFHAINRLVHFLENYSVSALNGEDARTDRYDALVPFVHSVLREQVKTAKTLVDRLEALETAQ